MKSKHLTRNLLAIVLALVALTFLSGAVLTFGHAQAAVSPTRAASTLAENAQAASPTPTKTPVPPSADTTGVIALTIVIVAVILVGATWGRRLAPNKAKSK